MIDYSHSSVDKQGLKHEILGLLIAESLTGDRLTDGPTGCQRTGRVTDLQTYRHVDAPTNVETNQVTVDVSRLAVGSSKHFFSGSDTSPEVAKSCIS